jgi:D-lyxose ketol-isomerase
MKRSEVNALIAEAEAFFHAFSCQLPSFGYWSVEKMRAGATKIIRNNRLGWDITDYGEERFDELGLLLFTARNGHVGDLARGKGMLYAEKYMISRKDQLSPMHKHNVKAEDIINRGGGQLIIELFASDAEGQIDRNGTVAVTCDGLELKFRAGEHLMLEPGQSVTLMPGVWHAFWAESADVFIGEVSTVNDDLTDNIFEMPIKRFSTIEEDTSPSRLLVSDYDNFLPPIM